VENIPDIIFCAFDSVGNVVDITRRLKLAHELPGVEQYRYVRSKDIIEALAGLEGFIPETVTEAYLQRALKQIEEIVMPANACNRGWQTRSV